MDSQCALVLCRDGSRCRQPAGPKQSVGVADVGSDAVVVLEQSVSDGRELGLQALRQVSYVRRVEDFPRPLAQGESVLAPSAAPSRGAIVLDELVDRTSGLVCGGVHG